MASRQSNNEEDIPELSSSTDQINLSLNVHCSNEATSTGHSQDDPEDNNDNDPVTNQDLEEYGKTTAESFVNEFGSASKSNLQDAFLKYRTERQVCLLPYSMFYYVPHYMRCYFI